MSNDTQYVLSNEIDLKYKHNKMTMSSKKEVLTLKKDNRKGIAPSKDLQKKVAFFLKNHNTTSACFILGTDYSTLKKVSNGESVRDYIITRLEQRLADAKQNISL